MTNPLSMFHEKGAETERWSMTRVVAFLFAITICSALLLYARGAHEISWPFAVVAIVTLLAVPLQALCRYLQQWIASSPGQAVIKQLAEKFLHGDHS